MATEPSSSVRAELKIVSPALFSFLADNFGLAVILPLIAIRSQFLIDRVDVAAGLGGWATRGGENATATAVPLGSAGRAILRPGVQKSSSVWFTFSSIVALSSSCTRRAIGALASSHGRPTGAAGAAATAEARRSAKSIA